MPRTYERKAKQTRLAFNPIASASPQENNNDSQRIPADEKSREANLRYKHPSMPTIRRGKRQPTPPLPPPAASSDTEKEAIAVEDSDSDLEIAHSKPKKTGKQPLKRKRSPESEKANSSEEDSDAEIVTRPRRKLRRGGAPKPTVVLDDVEDHDSNKSEEEEEQEKDDDEDDDEPVVVTPAKRRKRNMVPEDPQTPSRGADQDKLDIEEDLEDLQDSVVKDTRTRGRLANSARSKRQQHLEALRRRRAGDKESEATNSEFGSEEEDDDDDDEESSSEESQPRATASATYQPQLGIFQTDNSDVESAIASNEDLDRYDEDFISEDENDTLGVPGPGTGLEDMPLEFTRHAYKQTKEYFRDAVEWMVHNQLNPAFSRAAPLYKVAFGKLEDEVKGRTGSQLVSSVWNAGFHRALMARPHIEVTAYPISDDHPCDACNRSGHPASFDVKFYGKAYSLDTLEALTDGSDDEEDADTTETDRDGNILPTEDTRFLLGRHCKVRATMAHTLTHWRFHLNEWVTDYLDHQCILSDENILHRSHWSQKRKTRHATEVVMMMDQTGEVKKLWRDFHIILKDARESTTDRLSPLLLFYI